MREISMFATDCYFRPGGGTVKNQPTNGVTDSLRSSVPELIDRKPIETKGYQGRDKLLYCSCSLKSLANKECTIKLMT